MIETLSRTFFRGYQAVFKVAIPLLPYPVPDLLTGPGSVQKLASVIEKQGLKQMLIVTDKGLTGIGLLDGLYESLKASGIGFVVFDDVQPNPSIQNIEDGFKLYRDNSCDSIIAFGGGSPMDCAKVIGARVVKPKKPVAKLRGKFKILKSLPPLFAVPTTAGTGSETTVAAVISDPVEHEKFAILDLSLVPDYAVLDPELMVGLPPHITSTTGMDALTHAVEAYIGWQGTRFTNDNAEKATRLIFDNLEAVYKDGSDLEKRNNMALASYYAGTAFTRAQIGYVHAIAHNIGGLYGVPHGLANAVILPYVLEFSRDAAEKKLAALARAGGIGTAEESDEVLSFRFIEKIKSMNQNMEIPTGIKELQEKDIPLIVKRAFKEAHPDYPVPKFMNRKQCEELVRKLLV